jgi:hypothetical protein
MSAIEIIPVQSAMRSGKAGGAGTIAAAENAGRSRTTAGVDTIAITITIPQAYTMESTGDRGEISRRGRLGRRIVVDDNDLLDLARELVKLIFLVKLDFASCAALNTVQQSPLPLSTIIVAVVAYPTACLLRRHRRHRR